MNSNNFVNHLKVFGYLPRIPPDAVAAAADPSTSDSDSLGDEVPTYVCCIAVVDWLLMLLFSCGGLGMDLLPTWL